ncbi:MAG: putative Na+/H+ antiporter [Planctomycetota bacterium]|nr:putative Na+/H+ antiporter [Planctomycetota bacterium]
MQPTTIEIVATSLFAIAIVHTFLCSRFLHISHKFPEDSVGASVFHLLGEVEAVFGFWAGVLVIVFAFLNGWHEAIEHLDHQNFTEPAFVFAIMTVAATAPVIRFARGSIFGLAKLIPFHREIAIYLTCLVVGPLLGSFITEPAAMTVTAMILKRRYYDRQMSGRFMYITLAVLFVNVSIGGTMTPFAAPPVLMVAGTWKWDIGFMLVHFGWKSALAVVINAFAATMILRKELKYLSEPENAPKDQPIPIWVIAAHLVFLALVVLTSHHPKIFLGFFLYFLGLTAITKRWQEPLKLRESLLVGFFLAGLVVLGGFQKWWLDSVIRSLEPTALFLGATALTAFTDNAALTFLGSQVDNVTDAFKYALVAGAVAGGGLTVIANAPNPAGFSILQERFQPDGISPLRLALTALLPTLVAMACLWLLP